VTNVVAVVREGNGALVNGPIRSDHKGVGASCIARTAAAAIVVQQKTLEPCQILETLNRHPSFISLEDGQRLISGASELGQRADQEPESGISLQSDARPNEQRLQGVLILSCDMESDRYLETLLPSVEMLQVSPDHVERAGTIRSSTPPVVNGAISVK